MAMNSKRAGLLVILIPILILLGVGAYFAWFNLGNYESGLKSAEKTEQISRLGKLEDAIAKEFNCYAADGAECGKYAHNTDALFMKNQTPNISGGYLTKLFPLLHLKDEKKQKSANSSPFLETQKALKVLRKELKENKIDQKSLVSAKAYQSLIQPLEKRIQKEKFSGQLQNEQGKLHFYQQIDKSRNTAQSENILLSHYLLNKKPISDDMMQVWDKHISSYFLPNLKDADNLGNLKKPLEKLFGSKTYRDAANGIEDARIDIIAGHQNADYDIRYDQWAHLFGTMDNAHQSAQNLITRGILSDIENTLNRSENSFWLGVILVLLSLLFIVLLLRYYSKTKEEDSVLEQVVTNIQELSFDTPKDEVSNIPPMPSNLGDKKAVYAYLESLLKVLHQKEKEAKEANEAKSQFLANMSHELRTPLNGIVGFTQILKDTTLDTDQREFVSIIEKSSNSLLDIINDILDISKISAEKMELEESSFDLCETVESVIDMLTARAEQKEIILGVYIDPTLKSQRIGDPLKIKQVLTNLVGNAIKFTPSYGSVSVIVSPDKDNETGNGVNFSVKDTGIGISQEDQKKIFDAFTQVDDAMNRQFGGTGLGLALSSKMVTLMGGELAVESLKDSGSTFTFTIPLPVDESVENPVIYTGKPMKVGLALPNKNTERDIDKFRETYCRHLGHSVHFYYYDDIFGSDASVSLPDVMIFDHYYTQKDDELEMIASLSCRKIIITKPSLQNALHGKEHLYDAVVVAPVTFRKISKAFEQAKNRSKKSDEKATDTFSANADTHGRHALVAEDNPINQKLIVNLLQKFSMDVTVAGNGKEAVEKVQNEHFDIIFMDIQMPVLGGLEATEQIKTYQEQHGLSHTPIIALTANALAGDKERYLKAGMDGYLAKPIIVDKLSEILSRYFEEKEKEKEEEANDTEEQQEESFEIVRDDKGQEVLDEKVLDQEIVYDGTRDNEQNDMIELDSTKEEKAANKIALESKDILLYRDNKLSRNIYLRILEELGYDVDVLDDENKMVDALEEKQYRYVLYDEMPFKNIQALLVDLIETAGARPIIFCEEKKDKDEFGCKCLSMNASVDELKNILE